MSDRMSQARRVKDIRNDMQAERRRQADMAEAEALRKGNGPGQESKVEDGGLTTDNKGKNYRGRSLLG